MVVSATGGSASATGGTASATGEKFGRIWSNSNQFLGGTNSATGGRLFNTIDEFFLANDQLFPAKKTKSKRNLPDFSLIYKVWGIFWEELKLKYAMFVQQLDKVKEDDILTFTFLGFKFFGKFKIRSV